MEKKSTRNIFIRTTPENHERIAELANREGKSINAFILDVVKTYDDSLQTWKGSPDAWILNARANYTNSLNASLATTPETGRLISSANSENTAISKWAKSVNVSAYSDASSKLAGEESE
jgi:hypothetical protein